MTAAKYQLTRMTDLPGIKKNAESALAAMQASGFEIGGNIEIVVDKKLPFMGYTVEIPRGHRIVVSVNAVRSGFFTGLLLHEMSHIYRRESGHFSHDSGILDKVLNNAIRKYKIYDVYKVEMVKQALNHVEDLYADDIVFRVLKKNKSLSRRDVGDFFSGWIKSKPAAVRYKPLEMWANASTMLTNAFAVSNMMRHNSGVSSEAAKKNSAFLAKTGLKNEFTRFVSFMTNLKENTDAAKFKKQLTGYLDDFIALTV